ncbi:threonylcarbamoyl-AMP synthase [Qipengyuania flava]|nr:threonylcarbamoyl-AMP synthase [Qipengyuania flava]
MSGKYVTETLGTGESGLNRAAEILAAGGLVAVPTETVYGLAARADDDGAVGRIYAAKGRPSYNPLIVHVSSMEMARQLAEFSPTVEGIVAEHWPGPLTLVLPAKNTAKLASAVTAGLDTIAIRMPVHPVIRALIEMSGFPLAAPSANRSGFISPTSAIHVLATLDGRIDAVIDGGACKSGVESTIIAVRPDGTVNQLRPGPISFDGIGPVPTMGHKIEAPGQLASHYAPGKPMRLDVIRVVEDEFFIGFGEVEGDCSLSVEGDLEEAAARLYACLHFAAESDLPRIAVAPIPHIGVGQAINDRLRRAATPA